MASHFIDELRGWKETVTMSDDARRKVWLMHTAADRIANLERQLDWVAQQLRDAVTNKAVNEWQPTMLELADHIEARNAP